MITKLLNRFDGGIANNPRSLSPYLQQDSGNFDTITNTNALIPYRDVENDTVGGGLTLADLRIADVVVNSDTIYGMGRESSVSNKVRILTKTNYDGTWTSTAIHTSDLRSNTLFTLRDKVYFIDDSLQLVRVDLPSTLTIIGSLSASYTGDLCKPFVHPEDNNAYIAIKNQIFKYDPTAGFSGTAVLSLPTNAVITSLTSYGGNVAIATRYLGSSANSYIYLWGRDTSLTTLQDNIDCGNGDLMILENIGGILVGVKQTSNSFGTSITKKISIIGYAGGSIEPIVEFDSGTQVLQRYKANANRRFYFAATNTDSIYVVAKNSSGKLVVSKDRFLNNGTTVSTLYGFTVIGDVLFACVDDGSLKRTDNAANYTSSSYFITTINYGMDLLDRTRKKLLKAVSQSYLPLPSGASVETQYRLDGNSFTSVMTDTLDGNITFEASNTSSAKPFDEGREIDFKIISVGGAQVSELKYSYEVNKTQI